MWTAMKMMRTMDKSRSDKKEKTGWKAMIGHYTTLALVSRVFKKRFDCERETTPKKKWHEEKRKEGKRREEKKERCWVGWVAGKWNQEPGRILNANKRNVCPTCLEDDEFEREWKVIVKQRRWWKRCGRAGKKKLCVWHATTAGEPKSNERKSARKMG